MDHSAYNRRVKSSENFAAITGNQLTVDFGILQRQYDRMNALQQHFDEGMKTLDKQAESVSQYKHMVRSLDLMGVQIQNDRTLFRESVARIRELELIVEKTQRPWWKRILRRS